MQICRAELRTLHTGARARCSIHWQHASHVARVVAARSLAGSSWAVNASHVQRALRSCCCTCRRHVRSSATLPGVMCCIAALVTLPAKQCGSSLIQSGRGARKMPCLAGLPHTFQRHPCRSSGPFEWTRSARRPAASQLNEGGDIKISKFKACLVGTAGYWEQYKHAGTFLLDVCTYFPLQCSKLEHETAPIPGSGHLDHFWSPRSRSNSHEAANTCAPGALCGDPDRTFAHVNVKQASCKTAALASGLGA